MTSEPEWAETWRAQATHLARSRAAEIVAWLNDRTGNAALVAEMKAEFAHADEAEIEMHIQEWKSGVARLALCLRQALGDRDMDPRGSA